MRTGIPLFNVLNADHSTYNGKGKAWPLPKNRQPAEWINAEDEDDVLPGDVIEQSPGQAFGTGSGGEAGYFLTGPTNIMHWYRPGARLFIAEGKGALHRRRQHVIYAKARLLREITLNDGLIDTWPEAYMFCLLTARDRGEIEKIDCYRYDFSGIKLRGVDLRNSKFDGCSFTAASLEDCWFDGSSMRGCNFNRADLYNGKFRDCDMSGASFRQANLFHADFSRSNLTGAVTHLAQIGYTVLKDAKLVGDLATWELNDDGETIATNYYDELRVDAV